MNEPLVQEALNMPLRCPTRVRRQIVLTLVHPSPQLVSIRIGPPIEPTPILFSYCIFIALTANRELGFSNKKQALGEEWSYSLCSRPQVGISKGPSIHLPVSATCEWHPHHKRKSQAHRKDDQNTINKSN